MDKLLYLVAGLGKTGHAIANFLRRKNLSFIAFDTRAEVDGIDEFRADFPGTQVYLQQLPDAIYSKLIQIIVSPGVDLRADFLQRARGLDIEIIGDIECLAREISAPVIAITGTNGKSTVTTLVGAMAQAAGLNVIVAGNIGMPVLEQLDPECRPDLWVLELSSFQLDLTYSLNPIAATILNVTADHLDRHITMAAYTAAKQRIYTGAKNIIYNRQDAGTYPQNGENIITIGLDEPPEECHWGIIQQCNDTYLARGSKCLLSIDNLAIKGTHNWQNALAACAFATIIGISEQHIISVLTTFGGLPHRCQLVRSLNQVEWINDSKGTNVGATLAAIHGIGTSMTGKIVLIAGGLGKGADFTALKQPLENHVRALILIGEDTEKIATAVAGSTMIIKEKSMQDAVNSAQLCAVAGDTVLLSPACASFDMFDDFNHRGAAFANLVASL